MYKRVACSNRISQTVVLNSEDTEYVLPSQTKPLEDCLKVVKTPLRLLQGGPLYSPGGSDTPTSWLSKRSLKMPTPMKEIRANPSEVQFLKKGPTLGVGSEGEVSELIVSFYNRTEVLACKKRKKPSVSRGLNRELAVSMKFDHPNVMRMVSASCGTIMSYGDMNMAGFLKLLHTNRNVFSAQEYELVLLNMLYQVLDGLSHIHSKGYVHADIKETNIVLVRKTDNRLNFKIIDFGHTLKVGISFLRKGTIPYLSPEKLDSDIKLVEYSIRNTKDGFSHEEYQQVVTELKLDQFSPRDDIWAIGVIIFQIILGQSFYKDQEGLRFTKSCTGNTEARKNYFNRFKEMVVSFKSRLESHISRDVKSENVFLFSMFQYIFDSKPDDYPSAEVLKEKIKQRVNILQKEAPFQGKDISEVLSGLDERCIRLCHTDESSCKKSRK